MMCTLIYTIMKCEDVLTKPNLTFKLVRATKSFPEMCLQNQDEWQDLIRAVEEAEMKSAEDAMNIVVGEKVHHFPLQYPNQLTLS